MYRPPLLWPIGSSSSRLVVVTTPNLSHCVLMIEDRGCNKLRLGHPLFLFLAIDSKGLQVLFKERENGRRIPGQPQPHWNQTQEDPMVPG